MKKITILFAFLFISLVLCQSYAQDTKNYASNLDRKTKKIERHAVKESKKLLTNGVSNFSLRSFESDFGAISDVSWTRTDRFDEATFNQNGHDMTVYYDFGGSLVGTTTKKTFNDLPMRGQNTITKKYQGYAVESVVFYDFPDGSDTQINLLNGQFDDQKNYFVQLSNGKEIIIVKVDLVGRVSLFKIL